MPYPIIAIVGPTGCGKTVMIQRLRKDFPSLQTTITYTTRAKRGGESAPEDKVMRYVRVNTFRARQRKGLFLEWANVYGNLYGTDRPSTEARLRRGPVILNLDVQGTHAVKRKISATETFFILPTPRTAYLKRVRDARKHEANLAERLQQTQWVLAQAHTFDHVVRNQEGHLADTYRSLKALVKNILRKAS